MSDLTIYSTYPMGLPPTETAAACRPFNWLAGDLYKTPWQLDARLIGSIWRNVHTGGELVIAGVYTDRFDDLNAYPDLSQIRSHFSLGLGLWRHDHYPDGIKTFRVEHWVRIDHLAPAQQLEWLLWEVRHLEESGNQAAENWKKYTRQHDTSNAEIQRRSQEHDNQKAREARERAAAFARRHALPFSVADLNEHRKGQLVLF